jgi:3-methyladenine DNA glycosylase AlkD
MDYTEIIENLKSLSDPGAIAQRTKFGITPHTSYGVSIPELKKLAKKIGTNHELALRLWDSGIHEARILASMVDDPSRVDHEQMERWVRDFDSWDICDQCINKLFVKTELAWNKAIYWSQRNEEFVKRAGFVMISQLAIHDKKAKDEDFYPFLPIILMETNDDRNYVKKAVNWALRQIGKRSGNLNRKAIQTAEEMLGIDSKTAQWIAKDALRELTDEKIRIRLSD